MSKEAMKLALEKYMSAFGQALEAHGIPFQEQQIMADRQAREALAQSQSDVKQEQPYADKATSVSNDRIKIDPVTGNVQIGTSKQEQGEPVAYIHRNEYNEYRLEPHDNFDIKSIPFNVDVSLFKSSQQRTWEGLSVFEINDLVENTEYEDYSDLVERTEAKLKEKNT